MVCFRSLTVLCLALIISSCAGHKMALTRGQANVDFTNRSIALLSVNVPSRCPLDPIGPNYGPVICPQSETCSRYPPHLHQVDQVYKIENGVSTYLMSFELPSGTYKITRFVNDCGGRNDYWVNLDIEFKPNSVLYVGHLDILPEEQIQLIDLMEYQRTMTFIYRGPVESAMVPAVYINLPFNEGVTLRIKDNFNEDINLFASEFPALQNAKVEKSIIKQSDTPVYIPLKGYRMLH